MLQDEPERVTALLREISEALVNGRIEPLPTTPFGIEHASRALRFMAQDRHVGKVVLEIVDRENIRVRALAGPAEAQAPRGAVLVSGTNPNEQLIVASSLVRQGAEELILQSPAPSDEQSLDMLHALEAQGTRVRFEPEATDLAVEGIVVVASGAVLPDAGLSRAKGDVSLALELDRAHFEHDLEFFALVSSADALLGVPGTRGDTSQAFDAIARERRARGLHAASVTIAPGGNSSSRKLGEACNQLVRESRNSLIAPAGLGAATPIPDAALFQELNLVGDRPGAGLREDVLALNGDERRERLIAIVLEAVAGVLSLSASASEALDLHVPVNRLGIDSLMGLELRVGLERDLGVEIPPTFFVAEPSVTHVAELLLSRVTAGEN